MLLDRRYFLKMVGMSSFLFANKPLLEAFAKTSGPCKCVNILLHGFFFMEFQGDTLVIATPQFPQHHQFFFKDHGGSLQQLSGTIDLRQQLRPGPKTDFPSNILQFSRSDIQLDRQFFIDIKTPEKYAYLLLLPKPHDIAAIRQGSRQTIQAAPGNVTTSIGKLCGPDVALVPRLKYFAASTPPFTTRSYYAEHCHEPKVCEVNAAFDAARDAFGTKFDLVFQDRDSPRNGAFKKDDQTNLPDEISPDDENALVEISPCAGELCAPCPQECIQSVEPATCPYFGVRS